MLQLGFGRKPHFTSDSYLRSLTNQAIFEHQAVFTFPQLMIFSYNSSWFKFNFEAQTELTVLLCHNSSRLCWFFFSTAFPWGSRFLDNLRTKIHNVPWKPSLNCLGLFFYNIIIITWQLLQNRWRQILGTETNFENWDVRSNRQIQPITIYA